MHRGFSYRLHPTAAQAERLGQWMGTARFLWNLCLEQRRDFWRQHRRQTGRPITWVSQSREVTELRREHDWIADLPSDAVAYQLKALEAAFARFYRGQGFPRMKRRGDREAVTLQMRALTVRQISGRWSEVRLPKIGWVRFRNTRAVHGKMLSVTLSSNALGWTASFKCDIGEPQDRPAGGEIGIDRGVAATLTLSNGEQFFLPAQVALVERRCRKAQRSLARKLRGSKRHARQAARVLALRVKASRIRSDFNHRASTNISRRFGLVAIEALKTKNMTASATGTVEAPGRNVAQKRGLNRTILAQGWAQFATFLEYKLEATGGLLVTVPAPFTSQTCSACGVIDASSRKSQAVFACVHCGHRDNADVNAAIEILRRSTAVMDVEGSHWRPAEASIMAARAA